MQVNAVFVTGYFALTCWECVCFCLLAVFLFVCFLLYHFSLKFLFFVFFVVKPIHLKVLPLQMLNNVTNTSTI